MRWNRAVGIVAGSVVGMAGLGCSSDSGGGGEPKVPTTVTVTGNSQTGTVSTALPLPIGVTILDQNGDGLSGVVVSFAVTAGGGSLGAASVTSNSAGVATTTLTLGPTAGTNNNGVSVSVPGYGGPSTGIVASAAAGAGTQLSITAGDAQTAEVAQNVPVLPKVTVKDAHDNPVAGATVTWAVTAGGGGVAGATSMTDAAGEATMSWSLGPRVGVGVHALKASLGAAPFVTFTASGVLTAGTLALNGGDNQSGVINTQLAASPSVLVKTPGAGAVPVSGVTVNWAVTAGGGSVLSNVSTTDNSGVATNFWTVGGTAGADNQGLSATVAGLTGSPVTFVASATAPPTQMAAFSGDAQSGAAGAALAQPFVVLVQNAASAPVAGVTVAWAVTAGGGTLSAPTSVTDASGHAQVTLTVGTTAGAGNQSVTAAVTGLAGSPVTFTASVTAAAAQQIAKSSGDAQTATVNTALAQPIAVVVKDAFGNVKSGVTVNWAAAAGSGSTALASSVTNAAGIASTGWTIGTVAGAANQSATATAAGLSGSPLTFTASGTAGAPSALAIVSGDKQWATFGNSLPAPLVVSVKDGFGNPVEGASVSWVAANGGGSVSASSVATVANGTSSVMRTLGATVKAQTTIASVAGTTPASVTFAATGCTIGSAYCITMRFLTPMSPARQAVFDAAAARWEGIITGDVPDAPVAAPAGTFCGASYPAINETIDDVLIFVTLDSIDGPGQILGSAGPCARRTGTRFSAIGAMRFDTADVALMESNGIFNAVIQHEMGHVLGIGTLWNATGLPALLIGPVSGGGTDPYFSGASAVAQFNANGGHAAYAGTPVPVENGGGSGTVDSHWRESVMGRELMTGYVSFVANPLSTITVGSLEDMGYTVSYVNADPYTVNSTNLRVGAAAGDVRLMEAAPDWTIKSIDAQGRITSGR